MVPANRVGNIARVERSVGKRVPTLWAKAETARARKKMRMRCSFFIGDRTAHEGNTVQCDVDEILLAL